jgi:hypothetical protein
LLHRRVCKPSVPRERGLSHPAGLLRRGRQIHTGFNIVLALLFFPLLKPFARLHVRLLPARVNTADPSQPIYLDWSAGETPSIALAGAAREALGKIIGPIGLALIVGSSNIVKPDVTIAAILPCFLYLAAWSALAGFAYAFIGFETKGRSIEDIDRELTAGRHDVPVQGAVRRAVGDRQA